MVSATETATTPLAGRMALLARFGPWLGVLVVILLAAQVRARLLDVPLERDEGEYAYMGQLMLDGIPPYAEAYNMKLPGIYVSYAAVMGVFGESRRGIRTGLLLSNAACIVLVFLIGRRLVGDVGGLLSAATFALLSVSFGVQGAFANAEHFVLPPALLGLWFLLQSDERERLGWIMASGLCLGSAFLVKQHGLGFPVFGGVYLLVRELTRRPWELRRVLVRCGLFAAAVAAPYLLACLLLWFAGVFETFWFWTVEYASSYAGGRSSGELGKRLWQKGRFVVRHAPLLWSLAGAGCLLALWSRRAGTVVARRYTTALFVLPLALFSFLAITPGLHFRPHYFVILLPAASLAVGVAYQVSARLLGRLVGSVTASVAVATLCLASIGHAVHQQWLYLVEYSPEQVVFATFGANPFYESIPIANFIAERTAPDERIVVIGSEPQIYFYANRRGATGFVYTYALMEQHPYVLDMHRQMIREIEENEPAMLVIVKVKTSWLMNEKSEQLLLRWTEAYKRDFELVGLMDVRDLADGGSRFYHGASLQRFEGKPEQSVEIWQRRP